MKTLQLIESNSNVELKKFAGGECNVRILQSVEEGEHIRIETRLNSSDDFMNVCLTVDALRRMNAGKIDLFIPYVPYARQDRVMVPGESLAIKVFAGMLNALELNKVEVFDAHSDVTGALIDRCCNNSNKEMVAHFLRELHLDNYTLVSPDLGAYKKIDKLATALDYRGEIVTGIKIRDLATGQIIRSDINTDDLQGRSCVVIDDICDGGRTFIELAAALKQKNAGDLYLIVSHGIFSHNAIERLNEAGYKLIGCSNSISDITGVDYVKQFNLFHA